MQNLAKSLPQWGSILGESNTSQGLPDNKETGIHADMESKGQ